MAPIACRELEHDGLTGRDVTSVISYWPVSQKTHWHDARFCLGENPTEAFNRFDLCYSFKLLCWAEYGGTRQLHFAAKIYMRNYAYTAGEYQPRRILYERALRNLMVFMFSHYINHLENTGALEGHQTLMVHEYLTVASALGHFTSGKGGYSRETMINRIGLTFRLSARAIFATNTALCWC